MRIGGLVADFGLVMTLLLESQRAPQRPRSTLACGDGIEVMLLRLDSLVRSMAAMSAYPS